MLKRSEFLRQIQAKFDCCSDCLKILLEVKRIGKIRKTYVLKNIYWLSTLALTFSYLGDALNFIAEYKPLAEQNNKFDHDVLLALFYEIMKCLGPMAIIVHKPIWICELAYAGMYLHLLVAIANHTAGQHDGHAPEVVVMAFLAISFFTQNVARKNQFFYGPTKFDLLG